ncbi:hypothetical protein [uncultured Nostoc sp.]|uniref:hypothetical protein n=1 Tax=uncultured Nostoc sp. TaxID=340711 RepID=UPI0035C9A0CC
MTEAEQSDRLHLERRVEKAFFEAGKALAELRDGLCPAVGDRRLYRCVIRFWYGAASN